MHPLTRIVIWYEDTFGKRWEYETTHKEFKTAAIEIMEKYIDKDHEWYYTVGNITRELDYYNLGLEE